MIIDEAHNVLRIFEDSSSTSFTAKDVAVALSELDFVLDFTTKAAEDEMYSDTLAAMPNLDSTQVYALKDCLSKFETGLVDFTKTRSHNVDYTGEEVVKIFQSCGVTAGNANLLTSAIGNVLDSLSVLNLAGGGNKGKGLTTMAELVDMLYLDGSGANTYDKMKSFYRFHVDQVTNKFGGGTDTVFNLWCFHPGFAMTSLVRCNVRTLILTSGTLKPMDSFQAELSTDFPVRLQNEHVVDAAKQINYQVISRGPDGQDLIATFQSRSNPKYLTSLGLSLVEIAKVVPDGLLVFFPSYAWMDTCLANWKQVGVWERLNHWKQCYVEPKDRNSLARMVDEYRSRVRHVSRIGACFLAVCRGKVSEGIDFADADARAVVITGIPYPSVKDPKVNLKKKFLDSQPRFANELKNLSGTEWYNLEAFRTVNQSVGRVIRHKDDFGSVLLLDKRFAMDVHASKLSSWLPKLAKPTQFKTAIRSLENFFSRHQYFPKPKAPVSSRIDSKKRPALSKPAVQAANLPPQKRKKIVIKVRSENSSVVEEQKQEASAMAASAAAAPTGPLKSKPDIQQFVLGLKERLEKKELKRLILSIKAYKEQGDVTALVANLKLFEAKNVISKKDILEFRSFVRPEHEKAIEEITML